MMTGWLPQIAVVRDCAQALAMLDVCLCGDPGVRYYSFYPAWSETEAVASMSDGSGNDYIGDAAVLTVHEVGPVADIHVPEVPSLDPPSRLAGDQPAQGVPFDAKDGYGQHAALGIRVRGPLAGKRPLNQLDGTLQGDHLDRMRLTASNSKPIPKGRQPRLRPGRGTPLELGMAASGTGTGRAHATKTPQNVVRGWYASRR